METFKIESKFMWCRVCKDFTPHFIRLVSKNQDNTASIECSCSISDPVVLRNKRRIPLVMYEHIMDDKFNFNSTKAA